MVSTISTRIRKLNGLASWGPVITMAEVETIPSDILPVLMHEFLPDLSPMELWLTPTQSRERSLFLGTIGLPRFFSWVYPDKIAGMSTPRNKADCTILKRMGFTHVLSLTEETPLDDAWFAMGPQRLYIPLSNYDSPTLQEMDQVYDRISEGGVWLIHCGGGLGRAGTVLACLVAMLGRDGIEGLAPKLEASRAVALVRQLRPGSIESSKQEQFVTKWVSHRWALAFRNDKIAEPSTSLRCEGFVPESGGAVLFLIGKPGSGKSWFASAVAKRRTPGTTIVVSQDDTGSRAACQREISRRDRLECLLIFDRCNPSIQDRQIWLRLIDRPCIAVYFDYPKALCRQRIDTRLDHPTIRAGQGSRALDDFADQMQPAALSEGFASIVTVTSFAASRDAVRLFAKDPPLLKYPRTAHLMNLGSASGYDIVFENFRTITGNIIIEEKIDGANIGFSLNWDKAILCQNRFSLDRVERSCAIQTTGSLDRYTRRSASQSARSRQALPRAIHPIRQMDGCKTFHTLLTPTRSVYRL